MPSELEELRRKAREQAQFLHSEYQREIEEARQEARNDLAGWIRDIKTYMATSEHSYLSLDTIFSPLEWQYEKQRKLVPSINVEDFLRTKHLKEYAEELQKLLGAPFLVETKSIEGAVHFTIWWTR